MDGQNLVLYSKSFKEKVVNSFRQIYDNDLFTDVTLIAADNVNISAHKVILCSSSSYFKNLLTRNTDIITMDHINPIILKGIMEYLYLGQTKVQVEFASTFVAVAQMLQIEDFYTDNSNEKDNKDTVLDTWTKPEGNKKEKDSIDKSNEKVVKEFIDVKKTSKNQCDQCAYETKYKRQLKKHKKAEHGTSGVLPCAECDYLGTKSALYKHTKTHSNTKLLCDICDYKTVHSYRLKVHVNSIHGNVYLYCDQCEYKTSRKGVLKDHVKVVHEVFTHACKICEFTAKRASYLTEHQRTVHMGLTYDCDQCDFTALRKVTLKLHREVTHDKILYNCNHCDYKATREGNLKAHIQTVHLGHKRQN